VPIFYPRNQPAANRIPAQRSEQEL